MEVVYRLGFVDLLATGLLQADSGEFIFVEQHLEEHGSVNTFHLKVPYHCIVRLSESGPEPAPAVS